MPQESEPLAAQKSIEAAIRRKYAGGFAALDAGRLVAYLIGDIERGDYILWNIE